MIVFRCAIKDDGATSINSPVMVILFPSTVVIVLTIAFINLMSRNIRASAHVITAGFLSRLLALLINLLNGYGRPTLIIQSLGLQSTADVQTHLFPRRGGKLFH